MNRDLPAVTILTSGVGLGVYIPALLIQRQLQRMQWKAEVEVLEDYYTADRQRAHLAHKKAHHENFELARMAHRMARDVQECLDGVRVEGLIRRWLGEGREDFIVWSGFWLPIIERYRQRKGASQIRVDHCRIDAEISASFKIYPELRGAGDEVWLWNWETRRIIHKLRVTDAAPASFRNREDRLVLHGGGWGIGDYQIRIRELEHSRYALDVVVHDPAESRRGRSGDRYFMVDPAWHPWTREADGGRAFPAIAEVTDSFEIKYRRNPDFHQLYDVIRRAKAIVSKPGGCTLIDSLSSCTPVVFLEPYGYAEESNAKIWEYLGYGIAYRKWREMDYDISVLEELHSNLMAGASAGADYPREYAGRLQRKASG